MVGLQWWGMQWWGGPPPPPSAVPLRPSAARSTARYRLSSEPVRAATAGASSELRRGRDMLSPDTAALPSRSAARPAASGAARGGDGALSPRPTPHAPTLPTGNSRALTLPSLRLRAGRDTDPRSSHRALHGEPAPPFSHTGPRDPQICKRGERDPRSWRLGCSETPHLSPRAARPRDSHLGDPEVRKSGGVRPTACGCSTPSHHTSGPPGFRSLEVQIPQVSRSRPSLPLTEGPQNPSGPMLRRPAAPNWDLQSLWGF